MEVIKLSSLPTAASVFTWQTWLDLLPWSLRQPRNAPPRRCWLDSICPQSTLLSGSPALSSANNRDVVVRRFCIALFSTLKRTHCACMWFYMSDQLFIARFLNSHQWCTYSADMAGATWNCCHLGAFSVHYIYNHAPCYFTQSHIRKVYACLAVTCHLRFWQNDQDLLHATAVTLGWNGCQNKSAQKTDPGEENSPAIPAGTQTQDLSTLILML